MQSPKQFLTFLAVVLSTTVISCGKNASTSSDAAASDSSTSGVAASAAGGALSGSSANGSQALQFKISPTRYASLRQEFSLLPNASAASLCPTARSVNANCTTSGASMWLNYADCTFTGHAEWTGVQAITLSAGVAACGTFPNPGANGTVYRQFVTAPGSSNPGSLSLVAANHTATIDDASANLANFDGATIASINPGGGYGVGVTFASGARSQVAVGHHVTISGIYDHSVSGNLSVSETAGATGRTLNGSVKVYHNLLKVVGTSTFNSVVHQDICCLPISGSITTVFSAGLSVSPTVAGAKMVGKTETLTFTGCGTGTLQAADGTTSNVTLDRCF